MKKYSCQFPNCSYSTDSRHQIHYHHIDPVELEGSNKKFNRIWLCPTHHSWVYIPESKSGIHSIKTDNSMVLLSWKQSTVGRVLEYIKNGEKCYEIQGFLS